MAELKIIDVSKHNGIIDWGKVKNCGVDGVIIKQKLSRSSCSKLYAINANKAVLTSNII